jgi:phage terminase large subunit
MQTLPTLPVRYVNHFKPLDWQVPAWLDKSRVLLATGSAGGGKSRFAGEKLHGFLQKYPKSQGLIVRKTRASMTNGTIPFMEQVVIGETPGVKHIGSKFHFQYSNGSSLAYIGMDNADDRTKLRSFGVQGGVDIAWMEEASEFEESDFNEMLGRMRGTAGSFRQIILTTNPDSPRHWIKTRLIDKGEAKVFYSGTNDNPYNPDDYQATLNTMTGIEKERLVMGLWVLAQGVVIDTWDELQNVTEKADYIPDYGSVVWSIDDGYAGEVDEHTGLYTANSHPRVILFAQIRPDGQVCIFDELHAIKTLSRNHLDQAAAMPYPSPEFVVVDKSAAELKGEITERGLYVWNGANSVAESIKLTNKWIAPDVNGWRRIIVHPRCKLLRSEMLSYRYKLGTEEPIKEFDHSADALRYLTFVLNKRGGI